MSCRCVCVCVGVHDTDVPAALQAAKQLERSALNLGRPNHVPDLPPQVHKVQIPARAYLFFFFPLPFSSSPSCAREEIPANLQKVMADIEKYCSNAHGYKVYRETIERVSGPCIPYLCALLSVIGIQPLLAS